MFKKIKILNCLILFSCAFLAFKLNAVGVRDQMIQDLDTMKYHLSVCYAPLEWKKQYLGWDLEEAYSRAKRRILDENPRTSQAYQKILSEFLGSLHDYHVGINYYATAWSLFPIVVKKTSEGYYIASLEMIGNLAALDALFFKMNPSDVELISKNIGLISVGDEIIAVDSHPIEEVLEELIDENFNGDRSPTGYDLAVANLFFRKASLGQDTPQGIFNITLKNAKGEIKVCSFPWLHNPEKIPNPDLKERHTSTPINDSIDNETTFQIIERLLAKDFSITIADELNLQNLFKSLIDESRHYEVVNKDMRQKGFVPPLGKIIWESPKNSHLYAYIYQHPQTGKNIGYLYLPSFNHAQPTVEDYFTRIAHTIQLFNRYTEGLVFDISNNGGGNAVFMYGLLSLLTNKPLDVPYEYQILTPENIYQAVTIYKLLEDQPAIDEKTSRITLDGYPVTNKLLKQLKDYWLTFIRTWEAGESVTPPLYMLGIDQIMPNQEFKFKDKPLMVLVNSFCFSCADFFPAILQDNKQAVIFGQKTAGAGGGVKTYTHVSRFGLKNYSLTDSIAYRLNGDPIENLGVTPDIPCPITKEDISNNYAPYVSRINLEMDKLMK